MDDEQQTLWEIATRGVKPIAKDSVSLPKKKAGSKQKRPSASPAEQTVRHIPESSPAPVNSRENDFTGIDRRTNEKLRRGQMPIESVLDLHGCNKTEAYEALSTFFEQSYESGKRCVLVVTGKGRQGGTGILKQSFPDWIREGRLKRFVLQFHPAQARHGGGGAYYVLLRRKKKGSN